MSDYHLENVHPSIILHRMELSFFFVTLLLLEAFPPYYNLLPLYGLLHEQELKTVLCIFICIMIIHIFSVIRYESPYWRCLAASRIQVAWRYRRKRLSRANTSQPSHPSSRQWKLSLVCYLCQFPSWHRLYPSETPALFGKFDFMSVIILIEVEIYFLGNFLSWICYTHEPFQSHSISHTRLFTVHKIPDIVRNSVTI